MKFKPLILCAVAFAPVFVASAANKAADRWFEIEVILFNQLGDKSEIKENFSSSSELPNYRRVIDLLGPYLNPDIASLKQLLPSCDSPVYPASRVEQHGQLPALFVEKSLFELEQAPLINNEQNLSYAEENNTAVETLSTTAIAMPAHQGDNADAVLLTQQDSTTITPLVIEPTALTPQQQALVAQAELAFAPVPANYSEVKTLEILCRIPEQHFANMQVTMTDFSYNGFNIKKIPLVINGNETKNTNQSHLLSRQSLMLSDIVTDLKYSKNFKPLLHMGWRQVARPKKQAVAVKVYAGTNQALHYHQQLADYNEKPKLDQQSDSIDQAEKLLIAKQQRIARISEQITTIPEDSEQLFALLDNQDLSLLTDDNQALDNSTVAPTAPLQDWLLNGFFNVHLKHYLFITADFNVLDQAISAQATPILNEHGQVMPAKAIRFKQDRRVISGEVHYFDHPYIGMIVQIRPYEKPETDSKLDANSN